MDSHEVPLHSSDSSRPRNLERTHLPQAVLASASAKEACLQTTDPRYDTIARPDLLTRPAPAKRRPSTGDDLTSASGSVPCRVRFASACPPIRGSNQTRPLTSAHRSTRRDFTKPGALASSENNDAGWTGTRRGKWKAR